MPCRLNTLRLVHLASGIVVLLGFAARHLKAQAHTRKSGTSQLHLRPAHWRRLLARQPPCGKGICGCRHVRGKDRGGGQDTGPRLLSPDWMCPWSYGLARFLVRSPCPAQVAAATEPLLDPGHDVADTSLSAWSVHALSASPTTPSPLTVSPSASLRTSNKTGNPG